MLSAASLVYSTLLLSAWAAEDLNFPPSFKFGVVSAAYQVEGAWNVSDKGESIWDHFTHKIPSPIVDSSNGDIACDSYHLLKEDLNLIADVGADFYSFSISWPRLFPKGFTDFISEDGKAYYNNLIDGLLAKEVQPVVTLYHWDLPQRLQNLGGWTNPLIIEWFADYAREVFSLYADRVKTWITIDGPLAICDTPYMTGTLAPGIVSEVGAFICTKNVLMAHAKAWRLYDEEFKPKYQGLVSLVNVGIWIEAFNGTEENTAQLIRDYQEGRFAHAIYSKDGGWPPAVENAIAEHSIDQGYPWAMLPPFSKEEREFVKGTYDFYGLNFYDTKRVRRAKKGENLSLWSQADVPIFNAKLDNDPKWPVIGGKCTYYPEGMRKQLLWIKQQYGNISITITGHGCGSDGLQDNDRVHYYREYLRQVLLSIKEDGVNVTSYAVRSLLDSFEWSSGYTSKLGLYEVDFSSPNRTRTPRTSARYFAEIAKKHSLDVVVNLTATISPKSSPSADSKSQYIIFGGILLVILIGVIAAIVGCRVKRKAKYTAVNNCDQQIQNGFQNGAQNGHTANKSNVEEFGIALTSK